jgi:hypothetical protein
MGKVVIIDREGRQVPADDGIRRLIGRPGGAKGCSSTRRPGACEPPRPDVREPDAPPCPDDGPARDAVRVAAERVLWVGSGPVEAWR